MNCDHDAIRDDDERWMALPYRGVWDTEPGVTLVMRDCECRSTLVRVLAPQGGDE